MMKVTQPTIPTKTSGRWMQDYSDRAALLPNGVTLDSAAIKTKYANGVAPSGALVGRKAGEINFGPAEDTDTEVYFLWKDTNVDIEGNGVVCPTEVVRRCAIFSGLLPEQPSDTLKTMLMNRGFQFIPYTGDGIDE